MERIFDICWVCFPLREGLDGLRGELALARREFLTNGRKPVRAGKSSTVKGFSGRLRGRIARRSMFWEKKAAGAAGGGVTLEEAFRTGEGWLVVVRDLHGAIVSRIYFDQEQRWQKSEYYEPWNSSVPRVAFALSQGPGLIDRLDWDNQRKDFHSSPLYPAPYQSGTAEQSLADAQLGQPLLVLLTTKGELCCCPQSQAQARREAAANGTGGTMVLMPAWEIKEGELVQDGDANITFTSLEEYAKIQPDQTAPEPKPAQEASEAPQAEPAEASEPTNAAEAESTGPETPEPEEGPEEAGASSEQLEEASPSLAEDPPLEREEAASGPDGALEEILAEAQLAGEAIPREASQEPEAASNLTGRGRTQQPGGLTSYDGDYLEGKRHGFGAHYYKDGSLCYAGFWKDDRRDGPGVSFRDSDHAMHVAHWSNGQPDGLVALFDAQGNLRYSGRVENGKKEGAGVVINGQNGTVFVGQWSGGEATGLGSAFDREGRLLYYGSWQNGKRHGHGTQFDENGGVVFDGEFQEDKYYNGVLYQKLSQPEWDQ